MDAGGVMGIVAAEYCRGHVGPGEIHVRRAVVQPRHVRGVHAEVGRVVVEERKRAGQLGLLVDHLEMKNTKPCTYIKTNEDNKFPPEELAL